MPIDLTFRRLPFLEALSYFRQQLIVPSETWLDLLRSEHDWAWTVAGATKGEVVESLHQAVLRALTEGTTLEQFRADFRSIVGRTGWSYTGSEGWRTRVIYQTNLRVAHAAGRHRQMMEIAHRRPYWQYRHGGSEEPREVHVSRYPSGWNGMVLRHDHPWWETHYPPNDWGCSCYVRSLSERDVDRLGLTVAEEPPDLGTWEWENPRTGEIEHIPVGVGAEWNYAPGRSLEERREQVLREMLSRMRPELRDQVRREIERQRGGGR